MMVPTAEQPVVPVGPIITAVAIPTTPAELPISAMATAAVPPSTALAVPEAEPLADDPSAAAPGAAGEKKRTRKSGATVPRWNAEEEARLKALVEAHGEKAWTVVAEALGTGRTQSGVEQHWQIMTGKRKRDGRSADAGTDQERAERKEAIGAKSDVKAQKVAEREAKAEARAHEREQKEAFKAERLAQQEARRAEKEAKAAEREREIQAKAAEREAKKNQPKKPRSSYLIFCKETRQAIVDQFPTMDSVEIVKHQAAEWNKLPDTEKARYAEEATADIERYKQECAAAGIELEMPRSEKRRLKKESKQAGGASGGEGGEGGEGEEGEEGEAAEVAPAKKKKREPKAKDKTGLPFTIPEGFRQAATPAQSALEFGTPEGEYLLGKHILYNWRGVGWCEGIIILRNDQKRHTIDGEIINFYVHYQIDDNESAHVLELKTYGGGPEAPFDSWVILDELEDEDEDAEAAYGADAAEGEASAPVAEAEGGEAAAAAEDGAEADEAAEGATAAADVD